LDTDIESICKAFLGFLSRRDMKISRYSAFDCISLARRLCFGSRELTDAGGPVNDVLVLAYGFEQMK
jgi:hypothetical protein